MKNCRKSLRTHQFRHFLSFPLKTIGPRLRRNGTKWTSTVSIETSLLEKKIPCNFFVSAWKVLPTVVVHCRHCRYCCRHRCRLCRRRRRWRSSPLCLARTAHFFMFRGPRFERIWRLAAISNKTWRLTCSKLAAKFNLSRAHFFCHSSGWSTFVELFFFNVLKANLT